MTTPRNSKNGPDFYDDDHIDVPVYRREASSPSVPQNSQRDVYDVAGRARPQKIAAQPAQPAQPVQQTDFAESRTEELNLNQQAPVATQPAFAESRPVDGTPAFAEAEPVKEPEEPKVKRGTLSFGLLLLRLLVGGLLLVHGLQYLFAFGGNAGLNTLERSLEGYTAPDILAVGLSVGAVVAGALLVLGLLTPFGAALGAVVAGFFAIHHLSKWDGGLFPSTLDGTTQMWALLAGMSMIVVFTGPGRAALDRSRGWATRPLASAWVFALVAVAGLVGLWFAVGGGNPLN